MDGIEIMISSVIVTLIVISVVIVLIGRWIDKKSSLLDIEHELMLEKVKMSERKVKIRNYKQKRFSYINRR